MRPRGPRPPAELPATDLPESLRKIRALNQRGVRRRRGQALVEGPQAVRELLRAAPTEVRSVHLTADAARRHPDVAALAADALPAGAFRPALPEDAARAISSDAQGVLAVLRTDRGPASRTLEDLDLPGVRLLALLAQAADPGNAGTIIRAADAAGADGVLLAAGSVEHTSPKVLRASAGSFFHLPVVADLELTDTIARLRAAGIQVLAADVRVDERAPGVRGARAIRFPVGPGSRGRLPDAPDGVALRQ